MSIAELFSNIAYAGIYVGALCRGTRGVLEGAPVIFVWHDVQPSEASAFRKQIKWLSDNRRIVALEDIDAYQPGCISLTFDDGLVSVVSTVAPILEDLGVVGQAFVPTGLLGSPGHMTKTDVADLAQGSVISFGAHGRSHCRLSSMSQSELNSEIRGSKDDLEDILGRLVDTFCYPFGKMDDVGEMALQTCKSIGFRAAYSTVRTAINSDNSAYFIPRICVNPGMAPAVLSGLLDEVFWPEIMIRSLARAAKRW